MEILQAHELTYRHLGEGIIVPTVYREDGEAAETVRGELKAIDRFVGNIVLTIGLRDGTDIEQDVSPLAEVRTFEIW